MGRSSFQQSKRVTFGSPLQIPCNTAESDEESLDLNDVFVDAEDGSMTLDDLVQVAEYVLSMLCRDGALDKSQLASTNLSCL